MRVILRGSAFAAVVLVNLLAVDVARGNDLRITHARILPVDTVGVDAPLLLTIVNGGKEADALLRVRCPVANFSDRYTVDKGEGAPSRRPIPSIPIAAGTTTELDPHSRHVMLIQMREKLEEGSSFTCTIVFKLAGTISTEVKVSRSP